MIISPETQKERTVTTTVRKASTLLSDNHQGPALHYGELENVRARLSNTIDLSKLKNLNYNQHHDYYVGRDGSRLHFDQTSSKKIKTVDSDYFPVELGPRVIHTDSPGEHRVTTIQKTVLSPKQVHDVEHSIINQKIKLDPNHVHPTLLKHIDGPQKSARYEVEEDGISFANPNHHHHSAPGGVYKLSPEQYNDFKFLVRSNEPGDVVLFKPVSNHSHSSTSFNRQPSWILLNLALFIILIVNNIVKKY